MQTSFKIKIETIFSVKWNSCIQFSRLTRPLQVNDLFHSFSHNSNIFTMDNKRVYCTSFSLEPNPFSIQNQSPNFRPFAAIDGGNLYDVSTTSLRFYSQFFYKFSVNKKDGFLVHRIHIVRMIPSMPNVINSWVHFL